MANGSSPGSSTISAPRVQMESRLRDQAALAKLGEMAAVVAHEVKNPLAGIRGAMQVFGSRMSPDDASAQVLKDIVARIDSLDQMMKDMLLFARPPKLKRTPTEVAPLISMTASLLSQDPDRGPRRSDRDRLSAGGWNHSRGPYSPWDGLVLVLTRVVEMKRQGHRENEALTDAIQQ